MSKRDDAKAILGKYNIDSTEQINALREDTDRREQEMRGLDEQINSSAITEKIAIDARSRELYEKITNLRSKVAGFNEEEFQKILADIENCKAYGRCSLYKRICESLEQAKDGFSNKPVALSNIEFMETIGTNEKFAKLTGG